VNCSRGFDFKNDESSDTLFIRVLPNSTETKVTEDHVRIPAEHLAEIKVKALPVTQLHVQGSVTVYLEHWIMDTSHMAIKCSEESSFYVASPMESLVFESLTCLVEGKGSMVCMEGVGTTKLHARVKGGQLQHIKVMGTADLGASEGGQIGRCSTVHSAGLTTETDTKGSIYVDGKRVSPDPTLPSESTCDFPLADPWVSETRPESPEFPFALLVVDLAEQPDLLAHLQSRRRIRPSSPRARSRSPPTSLGRPRTRSRSPTRSPPFVSIQERPSRSLVTPSGVLVGQPRLLSGEPSRDFLMEVLGHALLDIKEEQTGPPIPIENIPQIKSATPTSVEKDQCSICKDNAKNVMNPACCHVSMCMECVKSMCKPGTKCPMCRAPVAKWQVVAL
jgi:hypothetical protein